MIDAIQKCQPTFKEASDVSKIGSNLISSTNNFFDETLSTDLGKNAYRISIRNLCLRYL